MKFSAVILILIALYLIFRINKTDQVGGAVKQLSIENKTSDPYYARQYRELDNIDNVLIRPLGKGNKNTEKLLPSNMFDSVDQELRVPIKKYLDFIDIMKKTTPEKTKVLVESKQPYFLDESLIIDYYGKKYYWDSRYPKQPISVEFAKDPLTYAKLHPNEYPSYVIASRNLAELEPNSDDSLFYEN